MINSDNSVSTPLLQVKHLSVNFQTATGDEHNVLHDINFTINKGETLALVGETGSGKSVTALNINRLTASPPALITQGEILFEGKDLLRASRAAWHKLHVKDISTVFQEPITSLHPTYTVGHQLIEILRTQTEVTTEQAREQAVEMLRKVGIPDPARRMRDYPYKLSGGMC